MTPFEAGLLVGLAISIFLFFVGWMLHDEKSQPSTPPDDQPRLWRVLPPSEPFDQDQLNW